MTTQFIHLHCHTEYSLIDSVIRIKPFVNTVKEANMPACAMTDHTNLFGLVKFYRAAQAVGVKPIAGADIWIYAGEEAYYQLTLLCQNDIGYRHLTRLISRCYQEGQVLGKPYLRQEWLVEATEGLIALSGGVKGDIGQALLNQHYDSAKQLLANWQSLFPQRFYLQLQRTGRPAEEEYIHAAVELAAATQTPVVATNEVCFLKSDDFDAHEIKVCIHDGDTLNDEKRPKNYSPQQYLRTPQEMVELFEDIPEAIENTWHIAQRCNLELTLGKNYLPDFPIPAGQTTDDYFCEQARLGLEERLHQLFDTQLTEFTEQRKAYDERLQFELNTILQMGFPGYFLIVADFIQWAKDNNIPVGPGRGSGAGSLVAYALKITDLDPLPYELLFERFLNPERVSMPDFDVDFCMEQRDDVIKYVARKYGQERVSQIITYGSMAAKAVVRDVGRVLGHPYPFVDQISKLIPFEIGITLKKALDGEEVLKNRYDQEEEVRTLLDMAMKLEGLTRNVGTHAGGVVIAPSLLTDFSPLYCDDSEDPTVVTQFDKGDVEAVGLVKFDFLGLRTLTIIKWALEMINDFRDEPLDIIKIPLDDPVTFELLQCAYTTAVFQLESRGMKELIKRLKPDCFEEIVALMALFRPGPLQSGMVDDFVDRKHGRSAIEYPHPDLAPILKPTYGVILYQEQVMQIAQVLANYSLGGADILRRAMGKKNPAEMAKQRSVFVEGATARGVDEKTADYIFDLMDKFSGYGFNKSHSAAYALVSYQTAWLKAHHPAALMAAVMSADMDNTDKVVGLINECKSMKLTVLPPEINTSEFRFTVADAEMHTILYGLGAMKGAGEGALKGIIEERRQNGPFKDLFDFCKRIDLRKANRRVLETLIKSGTLSALGPSRAVMMASLDKAIKLAEQNTAAKNTGQNDFFGLGGGAKKTQEVEKPPFVSGVVDWTEGERLSCEKETLGFYLSGHPINQYLDELTKLTDCRLGKVKLTSNKQTTRVAGWVMDLRVTNSKRGRMANITLEDNTARLEVTVYSDLYPNVRDLLVKDTLLIISGEVREDKFTNSMSMIANQVQTLEDVKSNAARQLNLLISSQQASHQLALDLISILQSYRADKCPVMIAYQHPKAQIELLLGRQWQVKVEKPLIETLQNLLGAENVRINYK